MSNMAPNVSDSGDTMIYCPQCGQAMLVRPAHLHVQVSCPHCQAALEPWRLVETLGPGVAGRGAVPPLPNAGFGRPGVPMYSWRNRWVTGILGVTLGPIGVHRFYLGYTGTGVLQIVVTLCTAGFGGFWGFIEGVLCLAGASLTHDVDGLPLRE